LMGSGIAFLAAAYIRRRQVLSGTDTGDGDPDAGGPGVVADGGEPDR
jgi:hypothetical protein